MGLLTDPGVERSALPGVLERHHRTLCVTLYLAGCVWFISLPHNALNHGTYFSENALLPGLVQGDFQGDSATQHYLESLREEGEHHPSSTPHPWLVGQFTQLGLDTYTHPFTLHYPMAEGKNYTGRNVYAILRASRGCGTEAVVVSAPYRPPTSLLPPTAPSIALMMSMAKFFAKQVYWAKDIIFLVTEHEQLGIQAWLEAYHNPQQRSHTPTSATSPLLMVGDLEARAGAIQAGINLEVHNSEVTHLDVKLEGLNGQLPNLDLVNLVHRLCQREDVPHTFKNRFDHPRPETFDGWTHQLATLLSMVRSQASGVPTGNHGLFHRYGVAAVTISGEGGGRGRGRVSLQQVGRVLEGVCRSLNNLLEKFHQSFFFYLLPSTNRYISIGVYMPPFSLIAGGLLVKALALWYSAICGGDAKQSQQSPPTTAPSPTPSLLQWTPLIIGVHGACLLLASSPSLLSRIGALLFNLPAEDSVFIGVLACCLVGVPMGLATARYATPHKASWQLLKIFVLLELAVLLFAVSVYNFSLALITAVIYTPVALIASPSINRCTHILKSLLILVIHPLSLLFMVVIVDTNTHFPELTVSRLLTKAVVGSKRSLMYGVADSLIYANWVFDVATLCLLPVWLLLFMVVQLSPQPQLPPSHSPQSKKSQ